MKISVVIPAYNEENHIAKVLGEIPKEYEVVVVDDGSRDKTFEVAKKYADKTLQHKKNLGKGKALVSGLKEVSGDVVVFMDADMQHNPKYIEEMLKLLSSCDMVIGARLIGRDKMPFQRRVSNFLGNFLVRIFTGYKLKDSQSGFRIVKKKFLDKMEFSSKRYDFEVEILVWAKKLKMKVCEFPVECVYGQEKSYFKIIDLYRVFRAFFR